MPQPKPFRNSRAPAEAGEETEFPRFKKPVGALAEAASQAEKPVTVQSHHGAPSAQPSSCSGSWPGCWRRASASRPSSSCSSGAISTASIRHRSHSAGRRRSSHRRSSALPCRWNPLPRECRTGTGAAGPLRHPPPRPGRAQSGAPVRPPFRHPAPGGRGDRYRRAIARRRVERHRYPADSGHRFSRQRPLLLPRPTARRRRDWRKCWANSIAGGTTLGNSACSTSPTTTRSPGNGRWKSGCRTDPSSGNS